MRYLILCLVILVTQQLQITKTSSDFSVEEYFRKTTKRPKLFITTTPKRIGTYLREGKIVPDIIRVAPRARLFVKYVERNVSFGNPIRPRRVMEPPKVLYKGSKRSMFYTLCMFDPDMSTKEKPNQGQWQNWLVVNIPGNAISKGETLTEYIGPKPLPNTGFHRYIFFLYRQPKKIKFKELYLSTRQVAEKRCHFSVSDFAKKYDLGLPVASNFFVSQYDYDTRNRYYKAFKFLPGRFKTTKEVKTRSFENLQNQDLIGHYMY